MASLSGYASSISGTTGSTNVLEPKAGYRLYILPRGAHASASSTGSVITFDSVQAAERFATNNWIQVGTSGANVRQVTGVGGGSIGVNTAVTVTQNDRVYRIGTTQPTISGSSATYQPHTTIFERDDDGGTPLANSLLTTDSNGGFQYFGSNNYYDAIIQDANVTNVGSLIDINIGMIEAPLVPVSGRSDDIGSPALPWDDIWLSGRLISAVTSASGATSHRFDTLAPITAGNLFQFGNSGTTVVYGDTWGGIFQSYTLPHVFNVKSSRFGAKGDGSTDDTVAITAAIAAAAASESGATGGIVYLPKGTYIVGSQITVTNRVRLVGEGRRNSIIKASAGFSFNGSTDAVIRIGSAGVNAFNSTVEALEIDCNNVANSIGIYSTTANEGSGPRNILIANYKVIGILYDTTTCQNWVIEGVELDHSSTTAVGICCKNNASVNEIRDVTINSSAATTSTAAGISFATPASTTSINCYRIHVEQVGVGIAYDSGTNGRVSGLFANSTVTTAGTGGSGVLWDDIQQNSATNMLGDIVAGTTFTGNGGGWYWRSNDGGSNKTILTSLSGVSSRYNSPLSIGSSLTVDGAFGVTGSAIVGGTLTASGSILGSSFTVLTAGTTLTIPAGNFFGLSSSPAGSTTIANIIFTQPIGTARLITLVGVAGTNTITSGNSVNVDGASVALAAGDCTQFLLYGTSAQQVGAKAS